MKKVILALVLIVVLAGAFYEVKHFNTSTSNNQNVSQQRTSTSNSSISSTNSNTSSPQINSNAFNSKAIDFKLKDLNGKDVSLSDLKGKRVFLNFWASWCPPCKAEMPDIERLYEETKDSDLVILAVNLGEDKDTVKSFIDKNNYKFRILLDSDQTVAEQYSITSIPTSFFIDKNGTIVAKKIGAMTYEEMKNYVNTINK
ncbi:TlpA family protein disulfide reductase [Clostridium magnum]|uniref:Thiol-disulfide oxidoreductase ResA n=1 Tax=Clostridium magnum DSM 2767 TaxID=1121326 RepID=A0A162TPW5_9CLOT|nr:TlpA disulfide reductase family protein [Clostridium magnum]KZL92901.1 thiol-disulfide oxidoreductase ResA [Clostridium magnum DSM 2767]SHI28026.1 Peroxiredoxin [Clostridium magnum DSM 2767]